MNCQDFDKLVLALARNQLLEATTRAQGLAHTETCERCAARLAEERALLAGVRVVVAELAETEAPARVEVALLAAFRQQVAAPTNVIALSVKHRYWIGWRLGAIAAGILLLISMLFAFWQRSPKPPEERAVVPQPVSSPSPQTMPLTPPEPIVERADVATRQPQKPRQRVRRQTSVNSADEAEVVTQFFPLREGEDLTALESARVVRVELPGSALSEVGLPVAPESANEPVKADVVLGQDGLARAIRFVR
jgi:hypothetical protein